MPPLFLKIGTILLLLHSSGISSFSITFMNTYVKQSIPVLLRLSMPLLVWSLDLLFFYANFCNAFTTSLSIIAVMCVSPLGCTVLSTHFPHSFVRNMISFALWHLSIVSSRYSNHALSSSPIFLVITSWTAFHNQAFSFQYLLCCFPHCWTQHL